MECLVQYCKNTPDAFISSDAPEIHFWLESRHAQLGIGSEWVGPGAKRLSAASSERARRRWLGARGGGDVCVWVAGVTRRVSANRVSLTSCSLDREEMKSLQAALQKQLDEANERAEKQQATVRRLPPPDRRCPPPSSRLTSPVTCHTLPLSGRRSLLRFGCLAAVIETLGRTKRRRQQEDEGK